MEKVYNPKDIEQKWYKFWENNNYFAPDQNAKKDPYCIMIPPPNVTGHLHMGHAFQNSLMDTLIRYHRMKGNKTLWQVGTDHAGIATQMVVERNLLKDEGLSRHDLGRDNFVSRIWDWKKHSGNAITNQIRHLGSSVDWSRERFTMDEGLSEAVQEVFIKLYREDLIYRGQRLVNWDPKLHTAVSDLEVISEEEQGHLWHIKYPIENSNEFVVIATTRPETLLGDTAVAVNPDDERYKNLVGKNLELPLCNRKIPVIADEYVESDFGTGCVKITPAHDFNDYEVGKRHNLEKINILDIDAKINTNAPEKYQGLDRFDARKQIVEDLTELGLIEKIEPHTLKVPRGDRTGVVIEPYLTDQWFVKAEPLAKPAIEVVKSGEIKFVPENWNKTYFEWLNNIQDWCISRQLWWGHRIPAWYDNDKNIYVGKDEAEVRSHYKLDDNLELKQDEDVLDTWFSSALWPFSTLGWPNNTKELEEFYPTNVLVTGFDIIFFWVARMVMFGLKFTGKIPFKEIYIHGLIQDSEGQKMSKSKGNILDPLDLIYGIDLEGLVEKRTKGLMQPRMAEKIKKQTKKQFPEGIPSFGTDALRFTFCALATTGRHIRFDLGRIDGYKNFCNKIWNAARYVFMNTEEHKITKPTNDSHYSIADKWINSKLQKLKINIEDHIKKYRFDLAAQDIYEFTWNNFCDWYLELSKPTINSSNNENEINATRYTLISTLDELLKITHPFMPFITEEIWQKAKVILGDNSESIMTANYPEVNESLIDDEIESNTDFIQKLIIGIRNIRGEMNISPNKPLTAMLASFNDKQQSLINNNIEFIKSLAKLDSISWLEDKSKAPLSATALADNLEILIPMKGLIDVEAESARLKKEIEKIVKDLDKSKKKLGNPSYVEKAPQEVVAKEQAKLEDLESAKLRLEGNLDKLANM